VDVERGGYGAMGASIQLMEYLLMKYKHTYVGAVEKVRIDYGNERTA
jgi:hypothetical protein